MQEPASVIDIQALSLNIFPFRGGYCGKVIGN